MAEDIKLKVSLADIQDQITKLNEMLNEKYSKLVDDEEYLEQEKAKFDSTHKILTTFKDPIKLNIGGKIFMTSRSTLMKEDSMLKSMFSGRYKLEKEEDGAYFIDRDPKYFGKILNFLRDGEFEMNDDEIERKEILREFEFFCLPKKKLEVASPTSEGTCVNIGNLSYDVDDNATKEFFKECGTITEIDWVNNRETGRFTGTGFITFDSPAAAQKALAMTGQEMMGRAIRCELAKPRNAAAGGRKPAKDFQLSPKPEGCTTVFAGQLSYTIDEESVREFFKDCGEISAIRWLNDKATGDFKGCAFVEFTDKSAVDLAVAKQGQTLAGRPIRLDYASIKF